MGNKQNDIVQHERRKKNVATKAPNEGEHIADALDIFKDRKEVVADTLDIFRERNQVDDEIVPKPFREIRDRLMEVKANGQRIMIPHRDSNSQQRVKIKLDYIGDRWALGYSKVNRLGEVFYLPYTIHYSDIYCKELRVNVLYEGDSPYGEKS